MNRLKKTVCLVLLSVMMLNALAPIVLAAEEALQPYKVQNGIVEYQVNKNDGRFTIATADGIPGKESDNDKNLLFFDELPETSFTTFRINGKDYIFGNNYGAEGGITSATKVDGYIAKTIWRINDVEITQKLTLITDSANPNVGNTKITYEVANGSNAAVSLGSRILLDTQLGSNDAAPMLIGSTYITNETEYSGENVPISWKSADQKFAPDIISYGLLSGWQNIEPDRLVIAHWESLSQTAWDFTTNPLINFTTVKNSYGSADSATAIYFDPTAIATGETRVYETFYGIGSISDTYSDPNFNIQLTSPQKLTVNSSGTAYNETSILITVSLDNTGIASTELTNIILKLGLSDQLTIAAGDAQIKTLTRLAQGETIDVTFTVIPTIQQTLAVAEYGVTVIYGVDQNVAEASKYLILPSVKGVPPRMQMTEIAPATLYTGSNKKSVVIKGSDFASLKADYEWSMYISNDRTGFSQEISRSNIYIEDATMTIQLDPALRFDAGTYTIKLFSANFGDLSRSLTFTDDQYYDRMEYGLLLIGAFGSSTSDNPVYTVKVLQKEEDIAALTATEQSEILLTVRGEISTYDLSGVTVYECQSGTIINNAIMYTAPIAKPESTMLICRYENGVEGWSGANSFFDNFEWFGKENDSLLISGEGALAIADYQFHYGNFYITLEDGTTYGLNEPAAPDYNHDVNENVGETPREDEPAAVKIITPANVIANEAFKPLGALTGVKINVKDAVIGKNTVSLGGSFSIALPWLPSEDDGSSGSTNTQKNVNAINDYQDTDSLIALNMEEMRYGINASDNTADLVGVKADGSINLTDDSLPMLSAGGASAGFKIDSIDYPGWYVQVSAGVKVGDAFECSAMVALVFETGGSCIPDDIELVVGGAVIKIPLGVTPLTVGYLTKIGGGVYHLYDTIKGNFNAIPPVTLKVITGYADPTTVALELDTVALEVGLTGISLTAEDGKIVKIPVLESMEAHFKIYDTLFEGSIYPCIDVGASMKLNLLDCIKGSGAVWFVADPRINSIFGHLSIGGKVYCGIFIPEVVPLLGGMELLSVWAELSSYRVGAGIKIIGIPLSVAYYWADKRVAFNESMELLANDLNIPLVELENSLAIEYAEAESNANGVMLFGGNIRKTYCSADDLSLLSMREMSLLGSGYRYEFPVSNQDYSLFELQYNGEVPTISVQQPDGSAYQLIDGENYMLQTIAADVSTSGVEEHYVYISVVDPMDGDWQVTSSSAVTLTAMDVLPLPEVQEVSYNHVSSNQLQVNWDALNIDDSYTVDIHIAAEKTADVMDTSGMTEEELSAYYKAIADSYDVGICVAQDIPATDGAAIVNLGERLADGNYKARVVLKKDGENYSSAVSATSFAYTNPNTPDPISNLQVTPAGNGQFKVAFTGTDNAEGYYVIILDENGQAIEGYDGISTTETIAYVGNTYEEATGYDDKGEPTGFRTVGTFPGSDYKVAVYAYLKKDAITYMSAPVMTAPINLPVPDPASAVVTVGGISPTNASGAADEVTVNNQTPQVIFTPNQNVTLYYKVDDGSISPAFEVTANTPFVFDLALAEGGSNLEFLYLNEQGDYTNSKICISVDTIKPTLMLDNTVIESENGNYVITGTAEANSVVYINGTQVVTANGSFQYSGTNNHKRQEIEVKAVDTALNETVMVCEVIPAELSRFVSLKIEANDAEIVTEYKIDKGNEAQLTVFGVAENGSEFELDPANLNYSVIYGNDKVSVDEKGVLKAEYYGDAVVLCEYRVSETYSFEETLSISVLSLSAAPTTIRFSNQTLNAGAAVGSEIAFLSVPEAPIGVSYVYSMPANDYVELVGNKIKVQAPVADVTSIPITVTAQGQYVLNNVYENIFTPIVNTVTLSVTKNIVSVHPVNSILVEKGTAFEALNLPSTVLVTLSDNSVVQYPVIWNKGAYNANVARVYSLSGTIVQEASVTNPDDLQALMQVSVNQLSLTEPEFGLYTYGYTEPVASKELAATNQGATDLTISNIAVTNAAGQPSDEFELTVKTTTVAAGTTVNFAVLQPVLGLPAGDHTAKVEVTYGNGFVTEEEISITVLPAKIAMIATSKAVRFDSNTHSIKVVAKDVSNGVELAAENFSVIYTKNEISSVAAPIDVGIYTVAAEVTNPNYTLLSGLQSVVLVIREERYEGEQDPDGSDPVDPDPEEELPISIDEIFQDIAKHWAKASIAFVYENKLFFGLSNGNFGPEMSMTRGMVVAVLARMTKDDLSQSPQGQFMDVSGQEWYAESVAWAAAHQITSGMTETEFAADQPVTRQQLVVMLKNLADYLGLAQKSNTTLAAYPDGKDVSAWAEAAMQWAVENGIISGREDHTLDPLGTATRAEVAEIVMRFMQNILK